MHIDKIVSGLSGTHGTHAKYWVAELGIVMRSIMPFLVRPPSKSGDDHLRALLVLVLTLTVISHSVKKKGRPLA